MALLQPKRPGISSLSAANLAAVLNQTFSVAGLTSPILYAIDATAAPVVQALPAALQVDQIVILKKIDATGHGVSASPNGTDTIDGVNAATTPITTQNAVTRLIVEAVGAWIVW